MCGSDDVFWTVDLIEETTQRLQDSYRTLTLIEHEVSAQNEPGYSLPEHVHHLKSYVQSLQRLYASCETAASHTENSVPFYPQRLEGQGPGRPALNIMKEQIEYLHSIHFSWEKIAQLLHIQCKCIYASEKTEGAWNK